MKIILVLLDGAGDRSYGILGNRTPLQAAETPNMDRIAALGSNGLYHAGAVGECLPSETAHFMMWGYEKGLFPGRGLLEAAGYGVPFEDADVLVLAHLAGAIWEEGIPRLSLSRKQLAKESEDLAALYEALTPCEFEGLSFNLHRTGKNDGILVIRGGASPYISDCDPMTAGMPFAEVRPLEGNPEPEAAERTALALNRYLGRCHRILEGHPVNRKRTREGIGPADLLVTQRAGKRRAVEAFEDLWGTRGLLIASGAVYRGLANELGLSFDERRDSRDPGKDLSQRVDRALRETDYGFIHVHTKVPDEAAHNWDPVGKAAAISELDKGLKDLADALEAGAPIVAALTADHSTPSAPPLIHSGETVPLVIAGPTARRDAVDRFDEISAARGCLGLLRGKELMLMLLNSADRACLAGHRLGVGDTHYFPLDYKPFIPGSFL
jgi:2,3-bisphosphoglycerate-independent phosphoglycerate mutase